MIDIGIQITRMIRLAVPRFDQQQMQRIADATLLAQQERIARGVNMYDQPAKPLVPNYAAGKQRRGLQPIRNLRFSGGMLASQQVMGASENSATVQFTGADQQAKARALQSIEPMVGVSRGDAPSVSRAIAREVAAVVEGMKQDA